MTGVPTLAKLRRLQASTPVGVPAGELADLVERAVIVDRSASKLPPEPTWLTVVTDVESFVVDARIDDETVRAAFVHIDNLPSFASVDPASLRTFAAAFAELADRLEARHVPAAAR